MNILGLHELIKYNFPQVRPVDILDWTQLKYLVTNGKQSRSFNIELTDSKYVFKTRIRKDDIRIELNSSYELISVVELYLKMN